MNAIRDWTEVAITAFGSLCLFCVAMAFLKTWMRGGS